MKELVEKRNKKLQDMKDLSKKVEEEKRAFTEEENALFDELEKEIKNLDATIQKVKDTRDMQETKPEEEKAGDDNPDDPNTEEEKKKNQEESERRAFAAYIRSQALEIRAEGDANLTQGANGAIIPTTIAQNIIKKVYDICPILEKSHKYNVKGKLDIPYYDESDESKITMAYQEEFKALTSKSGKFGSIELDGYLAGALAKIANSLINRTDFDLVTEVENIIAEAVALFIEHELLIGTEGKVQGISKAKQKVTFAKANAITADELIDLQMSLKQRYQKNAMFVMNSDTLRALRKLKDNDGRYILTTDLTAPFGYVLLGSPVYLSDNMPKLSSGNMAVVYADFSGLATKFNEELSIQVLKELFATEHATGTVAWIDFDGKIEDEQKIAVGYCPTTASV